MPFEQPPPAICLPAHACYLRKAWAQASAGREASADAYASHASKLTGRPAAATDKAPHHFISQDATDAVVVQVDEPVEPLHLVVAHLAALDD